jgi:hypothetical protein
MISIAAVEEVSRHLRLPLCLRMIPCGRTIKELSAGMLLLKSRSEEQARPDLLHRAAPLRKRCLEELDSPNSVAIQHEYDHVRH